jgi:hypothetical protein
VLSIDRISASIILALGATIITLLIDVLTAIYGETMPYVPLNSYLIIDQDSCDTHTNSHSASKHHISENNRSKNEIAGGKFKGIRESEAETPDLRKNRSKNEITFLNLDSMRPFFRFNVSSAQFKN